MNESYRCGVGGMRRWFAPSSVVTHSGNFDHAETVTSSQSLLLLFFFQSFPPPAVLSCTLVTRRKKKKEINSEPCFPNKKCVLRAANNAPSNTTDRPDRLWLIYTSIWREGFVLGMCFGVKLWCLSTSNVSSSKAFYKHRWVHWIVLMPEARRRSLTCTSLEM